MSENLRIDHVIYGVSDIADAIERRLGGALPGVVTQGEPAVRSVVIATDDAEIQIP